MNITRLHLFKRIGIVSSLLLFSFWVKAGEEPRFGDVSEEHQLFQFVDISDGPSLFVVAGMSYLNKSAYCEVNIEAFHPGRLDYSLTSIKGDILFRDHKRLDHGLNNLGISLADYPNGIYQLHLQLEQEQKILIIEKLGQNKIKASLISQME